MRSRLELIKRISIKNAQQGTYPFYTHAAIINAAFGGSLSAEKIGYLIAGSEYADSSPFQDEEHSYMHAMRTRSQSRKEAEQLTNAFVIQQLLAYQEFMSQGNVAEAFFQLGMGMHPLMDMYSPSHISWKEWDPTDYWGRRSISGMNPLPLKEQPRQ
jgi:hypothetical protein